MLTRVLETGVQEEATLEWRSEHGRFYSHMVRVAPEFDASEQVSGLLVLGFDITAQRREQLLDAARQRVFVALAHGNELADVLGQVAGYIDASGRGMRAAVMLLDESGSRLKAIAAPSLPEVMVLGEIDLTSQGSCCAVAALRGERVVCEQPCRKEGATCAVFASRPDLQACWSHPIEASSGRTLGVVTVYLQKSGEPQSSDVELLQEAANLCAIAIERKHIEQQMQRHASYDSLTGLPNRRLFGQRLRQELMRSERLGEGVALLFVDLDHFKEVNDSLGHEVGDRLLVEAANRLRECVRESDTVARLGGDEFVVILTQVEDVSALGHLAQGMVDRLAQPFLLDAQPVYVSASVGVAGYPLDARDAEGLIRCADQAMYAAKQDGRNNFSFFTASIQQKVHSRLQLAGDLREAMDKGQLQVYYQPIVDIATGEVVKAEALLRWQHPVRGMVPPDAFIPVAEEHGLIHDIGDWVFRQAVMTAKRWNEAADGSPASPLRQISVNLSPRQFAKGRIDKTWLEYLESLNADPRSIAIEITEGLLLDDRMDIMEMLARFGMAGMQVALDDFGTGYSAMAYLKKFPIDYLKIDRSFVRDIENDPNDRAIAEAIVVMSRKLGLKVIAEGVETEGQREILNVVGCEYVQGYLYAKPMREEDFLAFAGVM
jgi:diguanylate cyclase (GGDEF)-like protein